MKATTLKNNALNGLMSFGNKKLPENTAIFNMNSGSDCPSKRLGLCKLCSVCYAIKAEKMYPSVLPYRRRQEKLFNSLSANEFSKLFNHIANIKKSLKYLRFSESGDFENQDAVNKMSQIAQNLNVKAVYGYTARTDLDYSNRTFVLNISGTDNIDKLINGQCDNLFCGVSPESETGKKYLMPIGKKGKKILYGLKDKHSTYKGYKVRLCAGDCRICSLCAVPNKNIILCPIH